MGEYLHHRVIGDRFNVLRLKRSLPLLRLLLVLVERIKLRSGASGTSILFISMFIRGQTFYTAYKHL